MNWWFTTRVGEAKLHCNVYVVARHRVRPFPLDFMAESSDPRYNIPSFVELGIFLEYKFFWTVRPEMTSEGNRGEDSKVMMAWKVMLQWEAREMNVRCSVAERDEAGVASAWLRRLAPSPQPPQTHLPAVRRIISKSIYEPLIVYADLMPAGELLVLYFIYTRTTIGASKLIVSVPFSVLLSLWCGPFSCFHTEDALHQGDRDAFRWCFCFALLGAMIPATSSGANGNRCVSSVHFF